MSKDKISDYSATASDNSDIGGVGILGTDKISNVDDAIRNQMKQLAEMNNGTSPLHDTVKYADPVDTTKTFRFDAGNIATATNVVIKVPSADSVIPVKQGAPLETAYTASGTHTMATDTKYFQVLLVAGGGAGGSVKGAADYGYAHGGSAGQYGESAILARGSITTATVTIGLGGTAYNGAIVATDGGDTIWSDGVNTFTLKGGVSDTDDLVPTSTPNVNAIPGQSALATGLRMVNHQYGEFGVTGVAKGHSGNGASGPWGKGGRGLQYNNDANFADGNPATGYGAGGGGAASRVSGSSTRRVGGDGAPGKLIVLEW